MLNPIGKILLWTVVGVSLAQSAIKTWGTLKDAAELPADIPKVWGLREMLTSEQAILLAIAAGAALIMYGPSIWASLKERAGHTSADSRSTIPLLAAAPSTIPAKIDLSIKPLPQPPRQLTNFEIETKLKVIDLWIDFLVAEGEATTTEGRWILEHYDKALRDQDWRIKLVARAEEYRERARKLVKTAETMTYANMHHGDVLHLVHGNNYSEVASATDNFVRSLLDVTLNIDVPRDVCMRLIGPSALRLDQSLDALTRWRNQAHTSLVRMRRNSAP